MNVLERLQEVLSSHSVSSSGIDHPFLEGWSVGACDFGSEGMDRSLIEVVIFKNEQELKLRADYDRMKADLSKLDIADKTDEELVRLISTLIQEDAATAGRNYKNDEWINLSY